ncbi:glycosyltransferase [Agromyces aurantiacus]|uniref:Glycosyltransferase n=1 Tax=Agromyces aurantiacus TaxID=165814 RepID=A0ABV9R2Z2_9MICO|nr:glycosyltransferase [Agromyces aurantiacus]MBM7506046.1 poly(glycerol-phosphate) alpha-glucosyltransferase [Agromyces aurantiacus]
MSGRPLLPPGRQLAITWSIPDGFGGMTAALLRRSGAFVRLAGTEVDVLTFDGRPDYAEVRARLEERGQLVDGVRVRNLYERLRTEPVTPGEVPIPPDVAGLDEAGIRRETAADGAARLEVSSADGRLRVAHLRADGSLAVLDEHGRAERPRRLITAFGADGRPVRQWRSARACSADWIAEVAGDGDAFAIVDSKTAAAFLAHVRLPRLVTLHVVHNAHLAAPGGPIGRLRATRREVLSHPERFDAVVFLTERQRADAAALLGAPGNFAVVPNPTERPAAPPADPVADDAARDPASVVVVAGLTPRKRVDRAIRAVALARDRGPDARLRVVGDGPLAEALQELAREEGIADAVEFAGYRTDAADAFAQASVTLLTSTSEGAPLVLLEAMGRGCIPIADDIEYGPADVIDDGVNGFLVPPGGVWAMAGTIARIARMAPEERAAIRQAARATAAKFSEAGIVERWGEVERAAAERHLAERSAGALSVSLERVRLRRPRERLGVRLRLHGAPEGARVTIDLRPRRTDAVLRRTATAGSGHVRFRLSRTETALLAGGGPIRVRVLVEAGGARAELDAGELRPDTRSLARRGAGRLRPRPS